jgi:hypothetical protein
MFYGRQDVFAFIQRNLIGRHRDTSIALYGQRRTGKTSVLYQLHRHLDPSYWCVFIDLHGLNLNGMGNLMLGMASAISRDLRRDHQLILEVPDRSAFLADPLSTFETMFLDQVWPAIGDNHLVLMMDEAVRLDEEVKAGRLEREVFEYLRHLMQHHRRLNFIFSLGSSLEEMAKDYALLFSVSLYHRISFLEPADARELITQPVRDYYKVTPKAVAKILKVTSSHPYYTQLVCHCMFDSWSRDPKPVLDVADVDAVLPEAIELGSANLTYVWEDSTPGEQALMTGIATAMRGGTRPVTVGQARDAWRSANVTLPEHEATRALRNLTGREVLVGDYRYSFTIDLQRLWLDKHRRIEWVKDELAESITGWNRLAQPRAAGHSLWSSVALFVSVIVLAGVVVGLYVSHLTGSANPNSYPSPSPVPSPSRMLPAAGTGIRHVTALAFNPKTNTLATGEWNDNIYIWNVSTGRLMTSLADPGANGDSVDAVAFSPDGKTLAAADSDGTSYLWNVTTRHVIRALNDSNSDGVSSLAFSPDGKTLAAGDWTGNVYLWNLASGKLVPPWNTSPGPPTATLTDPNGVGVTSVAFSSDGKTLANSDSNGNAYLWSVTTRRLQATLKSPAQRTADYDVAFSPDGKTLATSGSDGNAYLWKVATGRMIATLPDPGSDGVFAVAFSPSGKTLATGDWDGSAYLWNVATHHLFATFTNPGLQSNVNKLAFSPNGTTLACGDWGGMTYLWHVG